MKPSSLIWELASNQHGQPITLTRSTRSGAVEWVLHQSEANQRDTPATIILSAQNLRELGEIIQEAKP
jgi:hypothetical protein